MLEARQIVKNTNFAPAAKRFFSLTLFPFRISESKTTLKLFYFTRKRWPASAGILRRNAPKSWLAGSGQAVATSLASAHRCMRRIDCDANRDVYSWLNALTTCKSIYWTMVNSNVKWKKILIIHTAKINLIGICFQRLHQLTQVFLQADGIKQLFIAVCKQQTFQSVILNRQIT